MHPYILKTGWHKCFPYIVIANPKIGIRCAYVRIPSWHPWYGLGYDDIPADVHGGLTFCGIPYHYHLPWWRKLLAMFRSEFWIGFDAGHCYDSWDPSIMEPELRHVYMTKLRPIMSGMVGCSIKDTDYMVNECRSLCEQAYEAGT